MDLINVVKALAHENRLRILNLLKYRKLCVCEIKSIMGITQPNASRHLSKLKQVGIIKSEQKAQWVYYYLNEEILAQHPFLQELIIKELDKVELCQEDKKGFDNYQASSLSCEDLSNKEIDLKHLHLKRQV